MPLCEKCHKRLCPRELKIFVDETVNPVQLRKYCKFCHLNFRKQLLKQRKVVDDEDSDDIL